MAVLYPAAPSLIGFVVLQKKKDSKREMKKPCQQNLNLTKPPRVSSILRDPGGHYCLLPSPPQSRYHESSDVFKPHNGFVISSTFKLICLIHLLLVIRTNSKHRERAREIERERGDQCGDK
ncbi:hypothetical protein Bca4012_049465 [Brassica carinata]